jgi:hypothetical protein
MHQEEAAHNNLRSSPADSQTTNLASPSATHPIVENFEYKTYSTTPDNGGWGVGVSLGLDVDLGYGL